MAKNETGAALHVALNIGGARPKIRRATLCMNGTETQLDPKNVVPSLLRALGIELKLDAVRW